MKHGTAGRQRAVRPEHAEEENRRKGELIV
jgi:hypothetical protein